MRGKFTGLSISSPYPIPLSFSWIPPDEWHSSKLRRVMRLWSCEASHDNKAGTCGMKCYQIKMEKIGSRVNFVTIISSVLNLEHSSVFIGSRNGSSIKNAHSRA